MTVAGIFTGVILILIGVVGYIYGANIGHASLTALIPAAFGIVIGLFSWIGHMKESFRMHMMHVAVLFGLLGFLLPTVRLVMNADKFSLSAATISQVAMAIVCLLFVLGSVQSFISARRSRIVVEVDREA
jgi:hypothetical protein